MTFKPKQNDDAIVNVALAHYLHDLEYYGSRLNMGLVERGWRATAVRDLLQRRTGKEIPTQP